MKPGRKARKTTVATAAPDITPAEPRAMRRWHAVLLLIAAIAVFFRSILLGKAFLWEDFLRQVYPFRHFAATSLARGELPLWNPFAFAGMPFQADIQSAVFYLPHLLLTPFAWDGSLSFYALEVMVIAHYAIAAVGMFALARDSGLARSYATFSGLVYALSGFMIVRAIHPGFVEQAAWLPWIILCLQRALQRRSTGYALMTGLLTGHAILAGAPQISLYTFVLIGCYALYFLLSGAPRSDLRRNLHAIWLPGLAVLVALGVAAIQLLPTLELAPLSERDALSFDAAQVGRLDWRQLITVLVPKFYGVHDALGNTYWGPGSYGAYWETCFYWGIPALLVAIFGATLARNEPLPRFLLGIIGLAFLMAVGDQLPLHKMLFAAFPGFSAFRAPARVLVLATFAMALLSGLGLRNLVELARTRPRYVQGVALGAMMIVVGVWVAARFGSILPDPNDPVLGEARVRTIREADIALALSVTACALALTLSMRWVRAGVVIGALILLQFVDILHFGQAQHAGLQDAESYYHGRSDIRHLISLLQEEQKTQLFRTTSRDGDVTMFDRNLGMVDGLYLTEGYTPLRLRRRLPPAATAELSYDLLNSKYRVRADTMAGKVGIGPAKRYLPRAVVVPAYTVIADDSAAARHMRQPTFDPFESVVLSQAPSPPLPSDATSDSLPESVSSELLQYSANSLGLRVSTSKPGVLVLSEIYYPGWRAHLDGVETQILRANVSLRAVPLSAGSHTITMTFEPKSFRLGAWITLLTALLSLGGLILGSLSLDHAKAEP